MAVQIQSRGTPLPGIDLTRFRRRIRLLRVWQLMAAFGCAGALLAIIVLIGDYLDYWDASITLLLLCIASGLVIGLIAALLEKYSDSQIARSVDRRSGLDDRLSTAYEIPNADLNFIDAVRADAALRMSEITPSALYPLRFHKQHGIFLALLLLAALTYVLVDTSLLKPYEVRRDAALLKNTALQVERISRPAIEEAQEPTATTQDKQLAHDLQKFSKDLNKGRMTKQEALIKANQLAEQAQKIESDKAAAFAASTANAQNAGAKLQQMADQAKLEKSDDAKLADQASNLQKKIDDAQHQLDAAKAGRSDLTKAEQQALQSKVATLQKQLQQIKLSQEAQEMMEKLAANKDYQQAQAILAMLQAEAAAKQAMSGEQPPDQSGQPGETGQPGQMTQAQLDQAADQLDQLAKKLNTDAKLKEYAKALLEEAKQARLGDPGKGVGAGLLGAFGIGAGNPSASNQPGSGLNGRGSTAPGVWMGDRGRVNMSDKSSLLHVKFQDRVITSQKGPNGPESYTDVLGPAQPTGSSGIPYQAVLPKYEKSAESALSKGNVPPAMRGKVRDYFDSLRQ